MTPAPRRRPGWGEAVRDRGGSRRTLPGEPRRRSAGAVSAVSKDSSDGWNEAFDDLRARVLAGAPTRRLEQQPPRLRRALAVAADVGAPALAALDAARSSLDDLKEQGRAVRVAAAQARAVAAGLLALPVAVVPLLGRMLELDLVAFYSTPAGLVVGALAAVLLGAGGGGVVVLVRRVGRPPRRATSPMVWLVVTAVAIAVEPVVALIPAAVFVRHVRRPPRPPTPADADEIFDLVATALGGGISTGQALRTTAAHVPQHADVLYRLALGLELGHDPGPLPPPIDRLSRALQRSHRWGVPAAPSLRQVAADLRVETHTQVLEAAERLPALLAFPTALCLLPASLLLIGAPLISTGLAAAAT